MHNSKYLELFRFFIKHSRMWGPVILMGIILICVCLVNLPNFELVIGDRNLFDDYIDPLIGIGTFVIAVFLGLIHFIHRWEESLDKKLSVVFLYHHDSKNSGPQYVKMIPSKVYLIYAGLEVALTHESDIRSLSQQIGTQLSGVDRLELAPYQVYVKGEIVFSKTHGWIKHYIFGYYLRKVDDSFRAACLSFDNKEDSLYKTKESNQNPVVIEHIHNKLGTYKSMMTLINGIKWK